MSHAAGTGPGGGAPASRPRMPSAAGKEIAMFYKLMLILVLFMVAIAALSQAFQQLPG